MPWLPKTPALHLVLVSVNGDGQPVRQHWKHRKWKWMKLQFIYNIRLKRQMWVRAKRFSFTPLVGRAAAGKSCFRFRIWLFAYQTWNFVLNDLEMNVKIEAISLSSNKHFLQNVQVKDIIFTVLLYRVCTKCNRSWMKLFKVQYSTETTWLKYCLNTKLNLTGSGNITFKTSTTKKIPLSLIHILCLCPP